MSDGSAKIFCFLDSNIWLYALIKSADSPGKQDKAQSLISLQEEAIVVSTQVVNEVCVNLLKKKVFDEGKIEDLIKDFYRKYRVTEVNREILLKASQLRTRYRLSFWDGLIVASALQAGARIIYSEDMQDGLTVLESVEIINPFK